MGKAKGRSRDKLADGYGKIDRALHERDVRKAISVAKESSALAEKVKDFYTRHDFDLMGKAMEAGHVDLESCEVDREAFLRENGRYCSADKYLIDMMEKDEAALGGSDALSLVSSYVHSILSVGFVFVGIVGLRASVTGNVVGVSSDGVSLSILFLVLGLLGLFLQIRKKN